MYLNRLLFFIGLSSLAACFPKPMATVYDKAYWGRYYREKVEPGATLVDAGPLFTLELAKGLYHRKTYFFDTKTVIADEYFLDRGLSKLQGTATYFSDLGQKTNVVSYQKGMIQDTLFRYHETTGLLAAKVPYVNGRKQGVEFTYDSDGHLLAQTTYRDDQMDGERLHFHPDGSLKKRELYQAGQCVSEPEEELYQIVQTVPAYPCSPAFQAFDNCGERSLMHYLSTNVRYPTDAREYGIQGRALISFVVDKEGMVTDVTVRRGICTSIQQECLRLMRGMPAWKPGMSGDQPVKVRYELPMNFKLE